MNEPRSIHAPEDWGVVFQSVPSKSKKEIVKRLGEIFGLDKRDAEEILSNTPLILVDNLSFGLAARIKVFFQKNGVVADVTSHDIIKKNCSQVAWPQTPDLSFFMKNETGPGEIPPAGKEVASQEKGTEVPKTPEAPSAEKPVQESPWRVSSRFEPVPAPESPVITPQPPPVSEEQPAPESLPDMGSGSEGQATELNEKLRQVYEEKQALHAQHAEAIERLKTEFQQRLEEEKQKSGEISTAYEGLQREAKRQESLAGEAGRSEAIVLGEKVRELEANLQERTSAVEQLIQQKQELSQKIEGLERNVQEMTGTLQSRDGALGHFEQQILQLATDLKEKTFAVEQLIQQKAELLRQSEAAAAGTQQELATLRNREQELSRKIEGLEWNIQEVTTSLRSRNEALAQFEKQVPALETALREKTSAIEQLTQQQEDLLRQSEKVAADSQQEREAFQNREQELSQKIEGLERNIQEMTESQRSRDDAFAQNERRVLELETALKEKASAIEQMIQQKDDLTRQFVRAAAETQQEIAAFQAREKEFAQKIEGLEQNVREMTESLRSRNEALAQFEQQIIELAEKSTVSVPPPVAPAVKPSATEVPAPVGMVAGLKKSPISIAVKSVKPGLAPLGKSSLPPENVAHKPEEDEPREKIIYIIRGNKRSAMEWHRIINTEAERKALERKYGRGMTIEEVIAKLTRSGWAVSHRDENVITFSRKEKPFEHVTFPLK